MMNWLRLGTLFSIFRLSLTVNVYLNPSTSLLRSQLSPEDASLALSQHLGLEQFEFLQDQSRATYQDGSVNFVGAGQKNALIVTMEQLDAEATLPYDFPPSFQLFVPTHTHVSSLSSVIRTYIHRARHAFPFTYEADMSIWDPSELRSLRAFFTEAEQSAFAALDLTSLADLRKEYGAESFEYERAVEATRTFIKDALALEDQLQLAILAYSSTPSRAQRRAAPSQVPLPGHAPPQVPIGSISTCFTSADTCNNATSSCSGRGQCVEASKTGRTCFVCTCSATKTGEGNKVKTEVWVGESCERKDVSGPFVLFVGSTLVLLILVFGSVSLLYGIGEQMLPPTLTGTAVNAKKD
ncbi:hypothetical protein FB446DRAFT_321663 [Lentinula raphanica]|nr:hypothetical protein FB446DRAFT_321663 [Lentinula raphanica]